MDHLIIPDFQPVPFPAPLWLLKLLLVLGFYLHALPMNVALAGGLVSGLYLLLGRQANRPNCSRIGNALAMGLPIFVSFAITQGIVPLLFLQLVYGPLYYTSSILMAVPWILILVLLIMGYYTCYIYKLKKTVLGAWGPVALIVASVLFAVIGFIFTSNMTLMLTPEQWPAVVFQGNDGMYFNTLVDPQVIPRYLHFLLASVAVTGLVIGCFGLYWLKREQDYGTWLIKQGSTLFLVPTLLQFGVGGWLMMSLSRETMLQYMGHDPLATVAFGLSMLLSLVAVAGVGMSAAGGKPGPFKVGGLAALGVVLGMTVMRHMLREFAVNGFFHPESVPVQTQWDLLSVFIVSAVGLIAYLAWLVKITWRAYHPGAALPEAKIPAESALAN